MRGGGKVTCGADEVKMCYCTKSDNDFEREHEVEDDEPKYEVLDKTKIYASIPNDDELPPLPAQNTTHQSVSGPNYAVVDRQHIYEDPDNLINNTFYGDRSIYGITEYRPEPPPRKPKEETALPKNENNYVVQEY